MAEAFIKEGKAAGKAAKKRKAPRGYAYVDDAGDDVDLMPPPPAPGKVNCSAKSKWISYIVDYVLYTWNGHNIGDTVESDALAVR